MPSSAAPLFHVSIRNASDRYFLTATPLIFVITPPLKTQARARDRESTSKVIPSSFSKGFSSRQSISSLPFQGILTQGAKPDFSPGFPLSSTNARNKKPKCAKKNRRRRLQTRLLSYACSCSVERIRTSISQPRFQFSEPNFSTCQYSRVRLMSRPNILTLTVTFPCAGLMAVTTPSVSLNAPSTILTCSLTS